VKWKYNAAVIVVAASSHTCLARLLFAGAAEVGTSNCLGRSRRLREREDRRDLRSPESTEPTRMTVGCANWLRWMVKADHDVNKIMGDNDLSEKSS
jgi:hypothetical protein